MVEIPGTCPHCGSRLSKLPIPEGTSWDDEFMYACFSDDCSYYKEGWAWIEEKYNHKASYRYMISPSTGATSPLPVWSETAMRDMLIEE
jgi:hypothetical protein